MHNHAYLVKEDDNKIVANAEVRFVELVRHVEAEALELAALEEDRVEPRKREQQLAITEALATSVELLLRAQYVGHPNVRYNQNLIYPRANLREWSTSAAILTRP